MDLSEDEVSEHIAQLARKLINEAASRNVIWPGGSVPDIADSFAIGNQLARVLKTPTWFRLISKLIKTPRSYKFFERGVVRAWGAMQGEISLQELMAIEGIRSAFPSEFSDLIPIIEEHVRCARGLRSHFETRKKELADDLKAANNSLNEVSLASHSGADRGALKEVVDGLSKGIFSGDSRLQSVAQEDRWTIYWAKLIAQSTTDAQTSDQMIIRDIHDYLHTGNPTTIVTKITSIDYYTNNFEHFSGWLANDWSKLSALYTALIDADIAAIKTTGRFSEEKSYFPLWRLWLKEEPCFRKDTDKEDPEYKGFVDCPKSIPRRKDGGNVLAWVSGRIRAALDTSIAEVNELYYYHTGSPGGTSFLPSPQVVQLRRAIVDYMRADATTAAWWDRRLQPGQPYALFHLMFHVAGRDQKPTLNTPSDWAWAMPALIEACSGRWNIIAPMLLFLVSNSYERTSPEGSHISGYGFDLERARAFCGNDEDLTKALLMTLAKKSNEPFDLPPKERLGCEEILRGIERHLASETASEP